jgi:hypothetical protein
MSAERDINPAILKFVAFALVDGLTRAPLPGDDSTAGAPFDDDSFNQRKIEIAKGVGAHIPASEVLKAQAYCFEVIEERVSMLELFAEDLVEAMANGGKDALQATLAALGRENRDEIVRALMRIVDESG